MGRRWIRNQEIRHHRRVRQSQLPFANMSSAPSQQELNSLAAACQRLWSLDVNGLQPGRDYDLNPQVSCDWLLSYKAAPLTFFPDGVAWQEVLHGAGCCARTPVQSSQPCSLSTQIYLLPVLYVAG